MRYLHVVGGVVVNVVEYPYTPDEVINGEDVVLAVTGTESIGTAFDVPTARSTAARTTAQNLVDSTLGTGKALRALVSVLLDEINALRGQIVGVASATWNPGNLANATGATSPAIAVAGAAFGDNVEVSASYSQAGLIANGYVSSAGNVMVRVHNGTGAAVNVGSGTWKVVVKRQAALPARTMAQARTAIGNALSSGSVDA